MQARELKEQQEDRTIRERIVKDHEERERKQQERAARRQQKRNSDN